jgi:type I restriction enzyme, S subunit
MGVCNTLRSISTDYLWHWFQKLDLSTIYDGSNVPQINNKNVEPLAFPLCSLAEQREIAKLLDEKLSLVNQLEEDTEFEIKKAEALRHSILAKAFSGQLVAQNPNDEPAIILVERITSQKLSRKVGKQKTRGGSLHEYGANRFEGLELLHDTTR